MCVLCVCVCLLVIVILKKWCLCIMDHSHYNVTFPFLPKTIFIKLNLCSRDIIYVVLPFFYVCLQHKILFKKRKKRKKILLPGRMAPGGVGGIDKFEIKE